MAETSPEFDFLAKIHILGDPHVGKTFIRDRYCEGKFYPENRSTISVDFKTKMIEVDGKTVKMQVWDIAGDTRYRPTPRPYYKGTMGILLCYAINNRDSFRFIENWMEDIRNLASEDVCIVLVGTKSDLSNERVVSTEEGKKLADSFGLKFFEISAKENLNICEAFLALAKEINEVQSKKKNDEKIVIQADPQVNPKEKCI